MFYETGNMIRGIVRIKLNLDIVRNFLGPLVWIIADGHDDGVSLGGWVRLCFSEAVNDFPALPEYC